MSKHSRGFISGYYWIKGRISVWFRRSFCCGSQDLQSYRHMQVTVQGYFIQRIEISWRRGCRIWYCETSMIFRRKPKDHDWGFLGDPTLQAWDKIHCDIPVIVTGSIFRFSLFCQHRAHRCWDCWEANLIRSWTKSSFLKVLECENSLSVQVPKYVLRWKDFW